LYTDGRNLFKSKKYQEALEKFEKSATYHQKWKNAGTNLYYLGYCYKELNNDAMALKVFNEVVEKYPNTQNANHAKSRIDEINR
jgi:TolA-binding protein